MTHGFDTGFFYRLLSGTGNSEEVQNTWGNVLRGEADGVLSHLVCFELYRHALRGALPREQTKALVKDLPHACHVVAIDELERCERTARLSHGNGLSMADAFILDAALLHGADRLYTTDSDMERYEGAEVEVVLL